MNNSSTLPAEFPANVADAWGRWLAAWEAIERWEFEFTDEEAGYVFALYSELVREGVQFDDRFSALMRWLKQCSPACNGNNDV